MMSELKEQVRFGRHTRGRRARQKRSVLVTLRRGEELFFGISKCHKTMDRWNKEDGLKYARSRARAALEVTAREEAGKCEPHWQESETSMVVHQKGVLGRCNIEDVKELLTYFEEVTEFLPKHIEEELEDNFS